MKPHREVFVVAGAHSHFIGRGHPDFIWKGHPDFGHRHNPDVEAHLAEALSALFGPHLDPTRVDKAYLSNFLGERFINQAHMGALLPTVEPRLDGKPIARIEAACASGSAAVAACVDAMQAGADVTLAAGVEIETNVPGKDGIEHMALAAHYRAQRGLDFFLFPHLFARRARAYKEAFGASDDDLARVAVKAYANASRNPHAQMRAVDMTFEHASTTSRANHHFLEDEALRPHIRLSDCTNFTDGASAVLLATEEGLRALGVDRADCTQLLAYGHATGALGAETDPTRMVNMAAAAQIAYADAGVSPHQVGVAEVHDCFTISELQMYEAIGLCGPGEAPALLAEGHTALDGRVPVNTGGGLLGFGHPVGATGVKQIVEVFRQLKGRCGDYQVRHQPTIGVTANLGGDDRTGIVTIQRA